MMRLLFKPFLRILMLTIDGEGDAAGGGSNVIEMPVGETSAERALDFWEKEEKDGAAAVRAEDKGAQDGAGKDGAAAADAGNQVKTAEQLAAEKAAADANKGPQLTDEQLKADPRYQEVSKFREEVQPQLDKYGIPDAKELGLQLADSQVLYDIVQGKAPASALLNLMIQNSGWTKDQVAGVAQDLIGWLTKGGFLKGDQGGAARGADGKFKDPVEERMDKFEREQKEARDRAEQERQQTATRERQTTIFNAYTKKIEELATAKGINREDFDFFGREVRALMPAANSKEFEAIVGRIEKGNFVDVIKLFDQVHGREAARLKRWTDKQTKDATRRDNTNPRVAAGGAPPNPAGGKAKRDLRSYEGRTAAAMEEWEKG